MGSWAGSGLYFPAAEQLGHAIVLRKNSVRNGEGVFSKVSADDFTAAQGSPD